jgi:hypothetical protein
MRFRVRDSPDPGEILISSGMTSKSAVCIGKKAVLAWECGCYLGDKVCV